MAKKKPEPTAEKSLGEKLAEVVDHLIHPNADQPEGGEETVEASTDADALTADVEKETDHALATEHVESQMQDHKKFDKFK